MLREQFLLDPDVVFLNHGSFGACPAPVFEAYQRFQRELERQPVEFLALERRFPELLETARTRLAKHVGAVYGDLAFTPNASSALNAVARSLELGPGDEVLLGDAEYGGMELLWRHVAERSGAKLVHRPVAELDPGPRTRVVFCSHIEWTSGRVNDIAEICRRARATGALSIVDGAHAPGQIDLDLDALGADVYAGNCHKWLCAPKGTGFLYARPEAQTWIEPLVISWDWLDGAAFHELHRWQGTRDPSAFLAVPAAIDFQAEHDWPTVRRRCHELLAARELRARAADRRLLADAGLPHRPPRPGRPEASALRGASNRGAGVRDGTRLGAPRLGAGVQRRGRPARARGRARGVG